MGGFLQFIAGIFTIITLGGAQIADSEDAILEAKLTSFLEAKGSPIPAEELLEYDNWQMILALSCAESGYGNKLGGEFNAWGIKDFRSGSPKFGRTRDFSSWEESIKFTSELLYKYDPEDGQPDAWGMVQTWKWARPYEHWVGNVEYALADIDKHTRA